MDVYQQPAIAAFELNSTRTVVATDHSSAIGVDILELKVHVRVVQSAGIGKAFGSVFHRTGLFLVQGKLADIDDVSTPVGHFATAVSQVEPPPKMTS